jgi:hypothetical protein
MLACLPHHVLHIVLDRARYHTCAAVLQWVAKNPRIQLHHLPAYSPNLNAIEPAWKIMHENTVNNVYSPTFKIFTETTFRFFGEVFPKNAPHVGRPTYRQLPPALFTPPRQFLRREG